MHCEQPLGPEDRDGFCCHGCRIVHRMLREQGLERYYDLREGPGVPIADLQMERRDRKWLEPLEERLQRAPEGCRLEVDVQGIHCSACVWLIQKLFDRREGGGRIVVNPALGKAEIAVRPGFALREWAEEMERFGYLLGPPVKGEGRQRGDDLLLRTGICVALAGNVMLFAAAHYLGLEQGALHTLLGELSWAAALIAVLVGGPVFFRAAWQGLRRRALHLDLPIAIGILLAFAGSTWSFFFAQGRASYLDTVTVFIALMLVGRLLQERVLAKNRDQLLASDGADALLARRVRDGQVHLVPCRELAEGDELLIAPSDLVPVDASLLDAAANVSLDWINGESAPRAFERGQILPAGGFNAGARAVRVRAAQGFDASPLVSLLRSPAGREDGHEARTPWWQRVAGGYVVAVLVAAGGALAGWLWATGDVVRSLEVTTAVLVVTCPCAFGIATPLAYELAQAGLRRTGLFVRTPSFLERARDVRKVVFDKTGTLTTGSLRIAELAPLEALEQVEREDLYDLASRSAHPKSVALVRALEQLGAPALRPDVEVTEVPGRGLEARIDGRLHRLGTAAWADATGDRGGPDAAADAGAADLVYSVDGTRRAALRTTETLRPHAARELARLRDAGYEPWILSGDATARVRAMAETLGLPPERAIGDHDPHAKAAWLDRHEGERALFVGDGINDSLAADHAHVAGTPAVDRPFMAARSDFYFVTPGLSPIAQTLRVSDALTQVVRRNLIFAIGYNVVAVSLALAGLMQPWLAAVLMPASSLASLAMTGAALSRRSPLWKS